MDENVKVVLADPEGSGLYNKVHRCFFREPLGAISLGRHSMTGQIWRDVRPQRSRRHEATASSRYGRRRDVRSSFVLPLIGGLTLPLSRGLFGQRDQSDDEQHRFGVAHHR